MVDYQGNQPSELTYQMLYPPEGNSSVLEVSCPECGEFIWVSLTGDKTLNFFFFPNIEIAISEKMLGDISAKAKEKLSITHIS